MKFIFAICVIACTFVVSLSEICEMKNSDVNSNWVDMQKGCVQQVQRQIGEELKASMKYLEIAAHFSQDSVNRPGFAKMFFKSSSEEREHAIKLIEYLSMRGELTSDISNLVPQMSLKGIPDGFNGIDALNKALELEASVTSSIRHVIKSCEDDGFNDFHLSDYLTGEFLEEQYKGQRELAGKASTLSKLMDAHGGQLGEFLFDKEMIA